MRYRAIDLPKRKLPECAVTVQGMPVTVAYAGPQGAFPGLDQINVLLSASLTGTGVANVTLSIGGQMSNITTVTIQ